MYMTMDIMSNRQLYKAINTNRFILRWGWSNILTSCLAVLTGIMLFVHTSSLLEQHAAYRIVSVDLQKGERFSSSLVNCDTNKTTGEYECKPSLNIIRSFPADNIRIKTRVKVEPVPNIEVTLFSRKSLAMYNASNARLFQGIKSSKQTVFPVKLLTLFTTMKETEERQYMHRHTLINWAALSPWVDPILFVPEMRNDKGWPTEAARLGWTVRKTPYIIKDIPLFKWMFKVLEEDGLQTPFIGYANADILFDSELIRTLVTIWENSEDLDKSMILIVGRRKNINVHLIRNGACLTCIRNIAFKTEMYQPDAEDYFIMSRAGFHWDMVPEFIVGRPGYDNWIVAQALRWSVPVIDASATINAVHQSGAEGIRSGWEQNQDPYTNLRLVSSSFPYEMGKTSCAPLKTGYAYVGCPTNQTFCVKLFPKHPLEIPSDCNEPELTTALLGEDYQYTDVMLSHDY